jgi:hypothetical protein
VPDGQVDQDVLIVEYGECGALIRPVPDEPHDAS